MQLKLGGMNSNPYYYCSGKWPTSDHLHKWPPEPLNLSSVVLVQHVHEDPAPSKSKAHNPLPECWTSSTDSTVWNICEYTEEQSQNCCWLQGGRVVWYVCLYNAEVSPYFTRRCCMQAWRTRGRDVKCKSLCFQYWLCCCCIFTFKTTLLIYLIIGAHRLLMRD